MEKYKVGREGSPEEETAKRLVSELFSVFRFN